MKKQTFQNIPNLLHRYRKTRGLSQRDVACILGLRSASMISRWESGQTLPSSLNILRLSAVYRTLVNALFTDLIGVLKDEIVKREETLPRKKVNEYAPSRS